MCHFLGWWLSVVIVMAPAEWKIIKEGEEEEDSSSDEDW